MVEPIECISTELQRNSLPDGEVLQSGEVYVVEIRAEGIVAPTISNRIQTRIGGPFVARLSGFPLFSPPLTRGATHITPSEFVENVIGGRPLDAR